MNMTKNSMNSQCTDSSSNSNCRFCSWLRGEEARPPIVYEDDTLVATLCDSPIAGGHTQIVFKAHYSELSTWTGLIPRVSAQCGSSTAETTNQESFPFVNQ